MLEEYEQDIYNVASQPSATEEEVRAVVVLYLKMAEKEEMIIGKDLFEKVSIIAKNLRKKYPGIAKDLTSKLESYEKNTEKKSQTSSSIAETQKTSEFWGWIRAIIGWAIFIYIMNTFVCN